MGGASQLEDPPRDKPQVRAGQGRGDTLDSGLWLPGWAPVLGLEFGEHPHEARKAESRAGAFLSSSREDLNLGFGWGGTLAGGRAPLRLHQTPGLHVCRGVEDL